MKYFGSITVFALAVLAMLFTSCSSTGPVTATRRFQDGASASMVLRFYSWNSIYMTRPDTREGGFLPLMSRDEVASEAARRQVPRDLAVVTIGATYGPDQLVILAREWKKTLSEQGFRRVVILRAGLKQEINGLPVFDDSAMSGMNEATGKIAPFATVPAATGAHVANPSITANR